MLEIDEAIIDPNKSVEELRKQFDGMRLYSHCVAGVPGIVKTIRELEAMGVIGSITLHVES